ncbi:MAG TPA: sensor histidine kinase, partial [Planctomycetaceae bacterium]|nr:sensor histidine kinase [Planctomycetaceae bacterium]
VYNADGELKRWVLINTGITRRRQEEESLRKAKEAAEASSRAKSEFLANISHEIRTPMNAILGMTELALATELTPEQREYLTVVHDSARSLLQFLNDVLDLSKIESGKLQLEQIEFNLADVVRETIRALAVKAHAKNLPIEISAPLDLPDIVQGDPVRVRQIVFNLLDNAIKFTERGSILVVLEEQWRTDDEVGIHLAVEDTGVGIPPDRLERIFESFTQADASTTRKFGGTGLGLTITAELVQMMDGRIWVQSSEGQGSTFHVTLRFPLASPEPLRQRIAEQMRQVLAGQRVLVVTRDATTRRVLHDWLKTWGCRASDASSLDAVRHHDANNVELMLVEIADVRQAQRLVEMAASLQEKNPHVIAIFDVDAPEVTHQCHQSGITCLVKPISQQALADVILARLGETPSATAEADRGGVVEASGTHIPEATRASTVAATPARRLKVLVVDDHDANRVLARRILERHGHECVESHSGADALQKWRSEPFDLVVLDVQMPEMDGFDVLRKMREEERESGRHTPVVTLTAHAMAGDRERCLAAGADAYLAKPLDASELLATVERLAGRAPATEYPAAPTAELDKIDFTQALERMDGDEELLAEQMKFFLNDGPKLLDQIQEAIDEPNPRQLELAAHRLKGLVAAYDAKEAADMARKLEEMGRTGSVPNEAGDLLAKLRPAVERLTQAMRTWLSSRPL